MENKMYEIGNKFRQGGCEYLLCFLPKDDYIDKNILLTSAQVSKRYKIEFSHVGYYGNSLVLSNKLPSQQLEVKECKDENYTGFLETENHYPIMKFIWLQNWYHGEIRTKMVKMVLSLSASLQSKFLILNIIDRYLSVKYIDQVDLSPVYRATVDLCMLYEEYTNSVSPSKYLEYELDIVQTIDFSFTAITPLHYISKAIKGCVLSDEEKEMLYKTAKAFLFCYSLQDIKASCVAASCWYISVLNKPCPWGSLPSKYCMKRICTYMEMPTPEYKGEYETHPGFNIYHKKPKRFDYANTFKSLAYFYKELEYEAGHIPHNTLKEISLLQVLDHPNVVKIKNVIIEKKQVCIQLEKADQDLHTFCRKVRMTPEIAKDIFVDCLQGLDYIHKKGIIHRDIKPGNILIRAMHKDSSIEVIKYKAIICDFGLATPMWYDRKSKCVCTLWYRPLELLQGSTSYGSEIDIWSLAISMLEMITGNFVVRTQSSEDNEKTQSEMKVKLMKFITESIFKHELSDVLSEEFHTFIPVLKEMLNIDETKRITAADILKMLNV